MAMARGSGHFPSQPSHINPNPRVSKFPRPMANPLYDRTRLPFYVSVKQINRHEGCSSPTPWLLSERDLLTAALVSPSAATFSCRQAFHHLAPPLIDLARKSALMPPHSALARSPRLLAGHTVRRANSIYAQPFISGNRQKIVTADTVVCLSKSALPPCHKGSELSASLCWRSQAFSLTQDLLPPMWSISATPLSLERELQRKMNIWSKVSSPL